MKRRVMFLLCTKTYLFSCSSSEKYIQLISSDHATKRKKRKNEMTMKRERKVHFRDFELDCMTNFNLKTVPISHSS